MDVHRISSFAGKGNRNVVDGASHAPFLSKELPPGDVLMYVDDVNSIIILDEIPIDSFSLKTVVTLAKGATLAVISARRVEKLYMSWRSLHDRRELVATHAVFVALDNPTRLAWIAV